MQLADLGIQEVYVPTVKSIRLRGGVVVEGGIGSDGSDSEDSTAESDLSVRCVAKGDVGGQRQWLCVDGEGLRFDPARFEAVDPQKWDLIYDAAELSPVHRLRRSAMGTLGERPHAGRAPGIFFDPCPTVDLLGGALKMLDCTPSPRSTLHNKAIAVHSTTPKQRNHLGYEKVHTHPQ